MKSKTSIASIAIALISVFAIQFACDASESHVDAFVRDVLDAAAKIKAVDPSAVPMAFWDFDGTIIKGDVSEGLDEGGVQRFKGLLEETIDAGLSSIYPAKGGWCQYIEKDYPRMREIGRWLAWPYNAQIYAGLRSDEMDSFCVKKYEEVYRHWYFASSIKIMKALEAAGVENHIVSASPELFVRNAAASLGLPRERFNAIRVAEDGGRITTRLEYPVPFGEGKVEIVRRVVLARPHGVAVAGFGNSYSTDGAFLRYIVTQHLPGGARGVALMINGGKPKPGYEGLFRCVTQDETTGTH